MAEDTNIEWCDSTHNEWIGCTRVSPACDDCYAARSTPARTLGVAWGSGAARHRTSDHNRARPLAWQRGARAFFDAHQRRRRVFCSSLSDWLDNEVPIEWLVDLLRLVQDTPDLDWLLLTKRIGNWQSRIRAALDCVDARTGDDADPLHFWLVNWLAGIAPENAWIGSTVIDQAEFNRDEPKLRRVPAVVRFLSIEPMLGAIDARLMEYAEAADRPGPGTVLTTRRRCIDWIIVGGESGPKARPLHIDWVRSLVQQCRAAEVPVLVKQLGQVVHDQGMSAPGQHWPMGMLREALARFSDSDQGFAIHLKALKGKDMAEWPEDLRVREFPRPAP